MRRADGSTVFLDEVGGIPLSLQSKLLRALQEKEFERVGDDRTIKVDVRVVAATNRDLDAEVKAGKFREDLYYRLGVFPILVPPLRYRREDIGLLAKHLLERTCAELGRDPMYLSKQQVQRLMEHRWPGNIREFMSTNKSQNLLITGPCVSGKTYIACAMGHTACMKGYSVKYYRLSRLMLALTQEKRMVLTVRHYKH